MKKALNISLAIWLRRRNFADPDQVQLCVSSLKQILLVKSLDFGRLIGSFSLEGAQIEHVRYWFI